MRFLFLVLATAAFAEPQEIASSLTLDQAVNTALRHNAQLRSMRAQTGAMQDRVIQQTSLANPMFKYGGMDSTDGYRFPDTEEKRYMIEQEFPWPGKLGLRGKIAGKNAEAMQLDSETMAREIVLVVKETYFDLYGVQQARALTRTDQTTLEQMLKTTESLYATGQRSQQDVIKTQSEITMLKQKLLDYDQQEATLQAKLAQLLNTDKLPSIAVTAPTAPLPPTGATRPEIKKAETEIQRSRYERDLMKKEYFADYRLGVEYRSMRSDADQVMFTIGFDLPIWQRKYRAGEREATKMIEARQAALESTRRQVAFDVQDATFKLQTAQKTLELYRKELLPQAEMRFKASESAYRTGSGNFLDLLESARFHLNARVMTVMAEANLGIQAARLERAVGTALPKTEETK